MGYTMNILFLGDSLTQGTLGASYFRLLQRELPHHTLHNYGRNGDTIISLYRRIQKISFPAPVHLAFLWIGTNDILVHISKSFPFLKKIVHKDWATNREEFKAYYHKTLDYLTRINAQQIITVPPLFIGEDHTNTWNKQLKILSGDIKLLSKQHSKVTYLDLRDIFEKDKTTNDPSPFIQKSTLGTAVDMLRANTPDKIDALSEYRGLHYTIDGIHLNNHGAQLVANAFLTVIQQQENR